jgi:hypothetical protein
MHYRIAMRPASASHTMKSFKSFKEIIEALT